MATRFYLPSSGTAPLGSLAVDSQWELSDNLERRPCDVTKSNTSLTQKSANWSSTTTQQWVWVQFQSKRLATGYSWTTSDTVSMVIKVAEAAAQVDSHLCYVIRVVSGDGSTIRGTIGSYLTTSTEYPTTLATIATRIHSARATGASNFSSQAGDRIIIEIGHHGVSPTLNTVYHNYGDPSATSDYALTADLTTDLCPWVELSRDVSFDLTDNQPAYTKGSTSAVANKSAYTEGSNPSYPASDNQPAFTQGKVSVLDNQNAYTKGSTVDISSIDAYTKGGTSILDNQNAYTKGSASDLSNKFAFTQGQSSLTDFQSAFTHGAVLASDNQNAYTNGWSTILDSINAFVLGSINILSHIDGYTKGSAEIIANKTAYTSGGLFVSDSQSAYTEGFSIGGDASTSKTAFVIGIDNNLIPDGDTNKVGVWKNELEQTTNLYQSVDELTPNDSDYVYNTDPQNGDYIEFSLSNPTGTPGSGDVVVFVRAKSKTDFPAMSVHLYQGSTPITTGQYFGIYSNAYTYYFTLTPVEKANITDWNDLRVRIYPDFS